MSQVSTFWNHNKEYFYMLKVEQNQRTFILPPPPALNGYCRALLSVLVEENGWNEQTTNMDVFFTNYSEFFG